MRLRRFLAIVLLTSLMGGAPFPTADDKPVPGIVVDKENRTITVDAKIAPRKIDDPRYKEIYPIEVLACWPVPKSQKTHQTVLTIEPTPSAIDKRLVVPRLKPGQPAIGDEYEDPARTTIQTY